MLRLTRESLMLDAMVELKSLVVQLLLAVKQSHERGVCHGKFSIYFVVNCLNLFFGHRIFS